MEEEGAKSEINQEGGKQPRPVAVCVMMSPVN
jgi:hypothetical protein